MESIRTESIRTPFNFEEHILKMDYSPLIEKATRRRNSLLLPRFIKKRLNEKIEDLKDLQEKTNQEYEFFSFFFRETERQDLCDVRLVETTSKFIRKIQSFEIEFKKLEGIATFPVIGDPVFSRSEKRKINYTTIPIQEGERESSLLLFNHPQIDLRASSEIRVEYDFKAKVDLGAYFNGHPDFDFTTNPQKLNWVSHDFKHHYRFYYGKPGKVFYRIGDKLESEIFGAGIRINDYCPGGPNPKSYDLGGRIYIQDSNQLYYNGPITSRGFFPFFILGKEGSEEKTKKVPKIENPPLKEAQAYLH